MSKKAKIYAVLGLALAILAAAWLYYSWFVVKPVNPFPTPSAIFNTATPVPTFSATTTSSQGWQTYQNSAFNFTFKYPAEFMVADEASGFTSGGYSFLNNLNLAMYQHNSFPLYTLNSDYVFAINSSANDNTAETCFVNPQTQDPLTEQVEINGTRFYHATISGAGAGNRYYSEVYRTLRDSTCFELALTLHLASDWNIEGVFEKADQEKDNGLAILNSMAASFEFSD